jgi:hypothetical protein
VRLQGLFEILEGFAMGLNCIPGVGPLLATALVAKTCAGYVLDGGKAAGC